MKIGIDIGSTTLKSVVLNESDSIIYKTYERHYSQIASKTASILDAISNLFTGDQDVNLFISGSAGMGISEDCNIPFVQEVYATRIAVNKILSDADVVIELGGEDAKILFLSNGLEVCMNGSCAGGTGAFVDQMAMLLNVTLDELNKLALNYDKIYTIASRCGVFAKTDIQSLLNQGAKKKDIAASILMSVVNQTISGLAQGRDIKGKIIYLGGPLSYLEALRNSFDDVLKVKGICPNNSLYFVAIGAAFMPSKKKQNLKDVIKKIKHYKSGEKYISCKTLFLNESEYKDFIKRHKQSAIKIVNDSDYASKVFFGIDAGSTTVKMVAIDKSENIIFNKYLTNNGNTILIVKDFIDEFYQKYPNTEICSTCVTGYGEEIIKNAFGLDFGIVETIAHFTAAKKFKPNVDFIIDIGGQDIKCFKVRNGVIDNIFLNEACSSGCGSFLQTFAECWGYSINDFTKLGLFAKEPVDLGSRCTVFMNSSVKQAQKDGVSIENISAGLSISVVKNALYKVLRTSNIFNLGENIVVQGGTFLNDIVLRAFEQEIHKNVIRPNISGLMGAYGAALYCKDNSSGKSSILDLETLKKLAHTVKVMDCNGCNNNCKLTVNTFNNGKKFIGGNKCEKPLATCAQKEAYNLFEYKRNLLESYKSCGGNLSKIGIPMGLNMFELLPFWYTFFNNLGFEVITSPMSSRELYFCGQHTIPSDTICYPAKLMHGHIKTLIDNGAQTIFYPCMSYSLDEGISDNKFNCPIVAYYPEVIAANVPEIKKVKFIYDYIGLHKKKNFIKKMHALMQDDFKKITLAKIKKATNNAFNEYNSYIKKIRAKALEYIEIAKEKNLPIIILAGRPYHLDNEINHGIDKLICQCGAILLSEDSVSDLVPKFEMNILNQWTYQARIYTAAKYATVSNYKNINLIQLISFGCGCDAISSDEVRDILESSGKIYTQIKIDEISNLGAVKIRLRSLFATLEQWRKNNCANK